MVAELEEPGYLMVTRGLITKPRPMRAPNARSRPAFQRDGRTRALEGDRAHDMPGDAPKDAAVARDDRTQVAGEVDGRDPAAQRGGALIPPPPGAGGGPRPDGRRRAGAVQASRLASLVLS